MPLPRLLPAVLIAVLIAVLPLAGCGLLPGDRDDPGQTRITLLAQLPGGGKPTPDTVEQTSEVLARRFTDAGLPEPLTEATGSGLLVTVEGEVDEEQVRSLVVPGELHFRKVLFSALRPGPEAIVAVAGGPGGYPGTREDLAAAVEAKLGEEAMAAAQSLVAGEAEPDAPELADALAPFEDLGPGEVAVLPATFQFQVPTISCTLLNLPLYDPLQATDQLVTACDDAGVRYLLDVAAVAGADVADAEAAVQGNRWMVTLTFTDAGQERWTALTQEAVSTGGVPFDPDRLGAANRYRGETPIQCGTTGSDGHCLVAMALDNVVISAPQILQVIHGPAQLSGDFTRDEAELLATQLKFGALPLVLAVESVEYQPPAG